jgi:hypothetical protein
LHFREPYRTEQVPCSDDKKKIFEMSIKTGKKSLGKDIYKKKLPVHATNAGAQIGKLHG